MKTKKVNTKTISTLVLASSVMLNSISPSAFAIKTLAPKVNGADSMHVQADANSLKKSTQTQSEEQSSSKSVLSEEKIAGIKLLSERFGLPYEDVKARLKINENCYLIPLLNFEEHKNCLIDVFAKANPQYMRYYLDGKLKTPEKAEQIYFTGSLNRMWSNSLPRSLNFIIDCDNVSTGRIAVGPLYNGGKINAEIGYAIKENYSGKGIVSAAVKTLLNLLQYLLDNGIYNFEKVRATAKEDNIASNKILQKNHFLKTHEMINDGYGSENEYFYYFVKKG